MLSEEFISESILLPDMGLEELSVHDIKELRAFHERGQFLYHLRQNELERTHPGDYVVINIGSGEYHVAVTLAAAEQFSRRYYPQLFYFQGIKGKPTEKSTLK